MLQRMITCILIFWCAVPSLAQDVVLPPSCIRVSSSNELSATIQFEPRGGSAFEAERYYNSRWVPYKAAIITTGEKHSLTVPLSRNLMNIVRVCAVEGKTRVCSSEGIYAKR